jgi:hypothetical protein
MGRLCAAASLVDAGLQACNPLESLPSPSRQQHPVHRLAGHLLDSSVNDDASGRDRPSIRYWGSRASIGLIVLGAIAAYFLFTEHRAHLFGALPFLLLLACPLMHVFMHRGHGAGPRHHDHDHESRSLKDGGPS